MKEDTFEDQKEVFLRIKHYMKMATNATAKE